MEMVRSQLVTVSKLSSEVQQLRMDNDALKMQLRNIQQAPSHVPIIQREAVSSAMANNVAAKSYRDVVCAAVGNPGATTVAAPARNFLPESSIVTGETPSDGDFVTVVRKKRISPSPVNTPVVASTTKTPRVPMSGVRSSSSPNTAVSPVPQRHPGFP
jgi:hypothetical protein